MLKVAPALAAGTASSIRRNKEGKGIMNKKFAQLTVVAAGAGLIALATVTAPHAGAATAVSAKAKTCAAVSTWSHHRTMKNLDALVVDSFGVPWEWLADDVNQLYMDIRGGTAKWVKSDLKQLGQDCAK
jgi:hypothetical protein